jgi:hypothetical protein
MMMMMQRVEDTRDQETNQSMSSTFQKTNNKTLKTKISTLYTHMEWQYHRRLMVSKFDRQY